MELQTIQAKDKWDRGKAHDLWLQYSKAEKAATGYYKDKRPLYKTLKQLYYQIKTGNKVIDLFKALQKGGRHPKNQYMPHLAICPANAKLVYCVYSPDGTVGFSSHSYTAAEGYLGTFNKNRDWRFSKCLESWQWQSNKEMDNGWWRNRNNTGAQGKTAVPIIPPQHLPKESLDESYCILWEVDEWKVEASRDPWLLRRIPDNQRYAIVLAGWDLTDLEMEVMNQHL